MLCVIAFDKCSECRRLFPLLYAFPVLFLSKQSITSSSQGRTHKNVRFRSPDWLATQIEKGPDLAVGWLAFSLLDPPFWILTSTCHMVHRRWTHMIKDGQCLLIKVFSCNIRYEIARNEEVETRKTKRKNLRKIIKKFFFDGSENYIPKIGKWNGENHSTINNFFRGNWIPKIHSSWCTE